MQNVCPLGHGGGIFQTRALCVYVCLHSVEMKRPVASGKTEMLLQGRVVWQQGKLWGEREISLYVDFPFVCYNFLAVEGVK